MSAGIADIQNTRMCLLVIPSLASGFRGRTGHVAPSATFGVGPRQMHGSVVNKTLELSGLFGIHKWCAVRLLPGYMHSFKSR